MPMISILKPWETTETPNYQTNKPTHLSRRMALARMWFVNLRMDRLTDRWIAARLSESEAPHQPTSGPTRHAESAPVERQRPLLRLRATWRLQAQTLASPASRPSDRPGQVAGRAIEAWVRPVSVPHLTWRFSSRSFWDERRTGMRGGY